MEKINLFLAITLVLLISACQTSQPIPKTNNLEVREVIREQPVNVFQGRRNFGRALSITNTHLTVLSDKYFYFYELSGSTWTLLQKIDSGDFRDGVISEPKVSFQDDTISLAQGSYQQFQNGVSTLIPGKLFVYEKSTSGWAESQIIELPTPFTTARIADIDLLGNSFVVSFSKSSIYNNNISIAENSNSVLYQKSAANWQAIAFFRPLNKPLTTSYSVSLDCETLYLGSSTTTATNLGSVFTFDVPNHSCN